MEENKLTVAAGKKVFIFQISNFLNEEENEAQKNELIRGVNEGVIFIDATVRFIGCFDVTGKESGESEK